VAPRKLLARDAEGYRGGPLTKEREMRVPGEGQVTVNHTAVFEEHESFMRTYQAHAFVSHVEGVKPRTLNLSGIGCAGDIPISLITELAAWIKEKGW
jgi:hypothetical protein